MHAKGIVHRDINPGNVLVADDGTAKLTDLGIARWTEVTLTGDSPFAGTAGYLAPEVAEGHDAGPAADVFSLGATLYAAVEGSSPWGGREVSPLAQVRRAARGRPEPMRRAGELGPALSTLMAKQVARRPEAAEVTTLLADAAAGTETTPLRRRRGPRARRGMVAVGVLTAAVLLTAGILFYPRSELEPAPPPVAAAGTIGDPRTADPCSLLDDNSLTRFGTVFFDFEYGNFNHCALATTLPDKSTVVTGLDLLPPDEYSAQPPVPGKLGPIQRPNPGDKECTRVIPLADLNRVKVTALALGDEPAELCAMAEAVTTDALGKLANGPVPRRATDFPPESTARLDACALLDDRDLAPFLAEHRQPEPQFGGWDCYWGPDSTTVQVHFGREWPLEDDPDVDDPRIQLGDRTGYVDTDDGVENQCTITVVHRRYQPAKPTLKGEPPQREETVVVSLEDQAAHDIDVVCATATTLARAVVNRLPPA